MTSESLSDNIKDIVTKLGHLIKDEKIPKTEVTGGWQYSGDDLSKEIESLKAEIGTEGTTVVKCYVTHFINGATIINRTKRLILIPIHGTPTLKPGGQILPKSYRYTEEASPTLEGKNLDLIFVVLEGNTSSNV